MRRMSDTDITVSAADRTLPAPAPRPRRAPRPKAETKPRRRLRLRLTLTPLQKAAAAGTALVTLAVGGAVLWQSGLIQRTTETARSALLNATAQAGFRIDEVTVSGRVRTSLGDIASALGAGSGAPILAIDLRAVRDRVEALDTVKEATVERRLPDALHVAIVERLPIAIWQHGGLHILVDRDGHQIPGPVAGFEGLPLVVGDGAGARADEVLALVATQPALAARVKAAVRVGNRRWNVMLDDAANGVEVRLPEDNPEAAWARLAELERDQSLTTRKVRMVDLRVPDRLVLKTERPPTPTETGKGKDNGA